MASPGARSDPSSIMKAVVIVLVVLLILIAIPVFMDLQPGGSGVLAALQLPDESQYMVTQRFNWSGEPYTVGFYMRSAGGKWGWCYIDHQAKRWRHVALTYDPAMDVVNVTERGAWRAAFYRKRGIFVRGGDKPEAGADPKPGTGAAPQECRQPDFPFPVSGPSR